MWYTSNGISVRHDHDCFGGGYSIICPPSEASIVIDMKGTFVSADLFDKGKPLNIDAIKNLFDAAYTAIGFIRANVPYPEWQFNNNEQVGLLGRIIRSFKFLSWDAGDSAHALGIGKDEPSIANALTDLASIATWVWRIYMGQPNTPTFHSYGDGTIMVYNAKGERTTLIRIEVVEQYLEE